jgi:hypothetical protein
MASMDSGCSGVGVAVGVAVALGWGVGVAVVVGVAVAVQVGVAVGTGVLVVEGIIVGRGFVGTTVSTAISIGSAGWSTAAPTEQPESMRPTRPTATEAIRVLTTRFKRFLFIPVLTI